MISVIVCTYNRSQILKRALQSLDQMSVPSDLLWELLIVDNNSRDDTKKVVEEFSRSTDIKVRYIFEGKQGLSHARNTGIRSAGGEIVLFTDNDVTVDRDWLWQIKQTFDQFDCIGVGGKIVAVWGCKKPSWLQEEGPHRLMKAIISFDLGETPHEIKMKPFGANMAFRKTAFEKYGLFRADLGRQGKRMRTGEDTEFGERLLRAGERLMYSPKAIVYHPVEKQRVTKRYFQLYYFNYGRFLVKFAALKDEVKHGRRPKYLFRDVLSSLIKWTTTLNSRERFFYKLNFYLSVGQVVETLYQYGKKA